ncbi:hypothetical protein ABZ816_13790 [Actinosynnema sp. NPDC047251]|uniref:Uncharacterized protein n=1 Tax=Saccharothrix espanaensis (strain ATCC 51144 / DSM 44229 / JCM 9112 / NBRC 15066 / NRRL 15764) TaxID=1179773 RepID=K0KBV5_SACES|nr:hypothetical protein [Saccharothrix espanaensis]CCH35671.1 hypothetical protein BN6_84560 [Saccharothrix espanaensis DSM 44229]
MVVLAVIAAGTTACGARDRAGELAAQDARDEVARGRDQVEAAARRSGGRGAEAALADSVAAGDPDRVFDKRTSADGFEVDAVFYGKGEAGGGWGYQSTAVRLCVRFAARLGGSPTVEARDVDCPDPLPPVPPHYGTVERTIRLAD